MSYYSVCAVKWIGLLLWFGPCSSHAAASFFLASTTANHHHRYHLHRATSFSTRNTSPLAVLNGPSSASSTEEEEEEAEDFTSLVEPKRERRKRYQGRYPRNFKDKYKELGGDESTIQKVLQKGMTPAGTHVPIMLRECLHYMGIKNMNNNNTSNKMNNDQDDPSETVNDGVNNRSQDLLGESNNKPTNNIDESHQPPAVLVVDCTLGYGGHSSYLIEALKEKNVNTLGETKNHRLIAFDQDLIELQKTDKRLRETHNLISQEENQDDDMFTTVHQNFSTLGEYLQTTGEIGCVTNLLADLGLSSMQIDDNERGFTYKREGPLDMRMNKNSSNPSSTAAEKTEEEKTTTTTDASSKSKSTTTETAYDLLCRLTPKQLKSMLDENSDEIYATEIANGLLLAEQHDDPMMMKKKKKSKRKKAAVIIPKTTTELADRVRVIVEPLMQSAEFDSGKVNNRNNKASAAEIKIPKAQLDSTVARVMQAIRIELNGEFQALDQLLADLPSILAAPNGRAVFLTFHSGEDRRVKKAFKAGFKSGIYSNWSRDVVRPSAQERRDNPRSSCCKLRWVVRSDKPV